MAIGWHFIYLFYIQSRSLFLYFRLFNTVDSKCSILFLLMTGFELRTTGIGSNRCTNWASTTALLSTCCEPSYFDQKHCNEKLFQLFASYNTPTSWNLKFFKCAARWNYFNLEKAEILSICCKLELLIELILLSATIPKWCNDKLLFRSDLSLSFNQPVESWSSINFLEDGIL